MSSWSAKFALGVGLLLSTTSGLPEAPVKLQMVFNNPLIAFLKVMLYVYVFLKQTDVNSRVPVEIAFLTTGCWFLLLAFLRGDDDDPSIPERRGLMTGKQLTGNGGVYQLDGNYNEQK